MRLTTEQLQQIIQEEVENTLEERCWDGYERVPGKRKGELGSCREQTNESDLNEDDKVKKDACYKKIKGAVKRKGGTWPSAYASGRLVQCRKVGAANWKEGESKNEGKQSSEDAGRLDKWFKRKGEKGSKGGWVNCNRPDGDGGYKECAREKPSDPKPYCRPTPSACKTEPKQNESKKRVVELRIKKSNLKEEYINEEEMSDKDRKELEQIRDKLYGASKAHKGQADKLDGILKEDELEEAVYQGRTVTLNKPMRGDVKKFKVYVNSGKKDSKGRIKAKKVNFGHGGTSAKAKGEKTMKIRKSNPKARKNFRARHGCDNPGPKTKAKYWSCKKW